MFKYFSEIHKLLAHTSRKDLFKIYIQIVLLPIVESLIFLMIYIVTIDKGNFNFIYIVILFILIISLFRFLINYHLLKSSYMLSASIGVELFNNFKFLPYEIKSNALNNGDTSYLSDKIHSISTTLIYPFFCFISNSLLAAIFFLAILLLNPLFFISLISLSVIFYTLSARISIRKLKNLGIEINEGENQVISIASSLIQNFKSLMSYQKYDILSNNYENKLTRLQVNRVIVNFITQLPKLIFEYLTPIFIILYYVFNNRGESDKIGSVILLLMIIQRLVPLINNSYQNISSIIAGYDLILKFNSLFVEINFNKNKNEKIISWKQFTLVNLNYKFDNTESYIFNDFNLTINSGEIIGVSGRSGSGKSTLIEIIMGLRKANSGKFYFDNKERDIFSLSNWGDQFGFLPQNYFLFNGSIKENLIVGNDIKITDYDIERVLKSVNLEELFPRINESAQFLSGGQQQRLLIARLLLRENNIIILDEPTSALDSNNSNEIVDIIFRNKLPIQTIIIISHDLSILKKCNRVIYL
jgi:ABC-type transport system involved in cytochrome bd biosynthesis fused ATPase/permease subunit